MDTKSFDSPDEVRAPDKTRVDVVHLADMQVARMTLQPGWRWSECVKPVAGTDSCQTRHIGAVVAGQLHVVEDSGVEADLGPGDAYVIEPGHDAWVIGAEPYVGLEFDSRTAAIYATSDR